MPSPARLARLLRAQARTDEMIQERQPLVSILGHLCHTAEELSYSPTVASILVLDADRRLRNGASPSLPADYLAAIDGISPHPDVGTCAAAAATGRVVVTQDFLSDARWAELKHLPLALGFVGAWSQPIKAPDGAVLGTFGTYFRERREPSGEERDSVAFLAVSAARAIGTLAVRA